MPCKSYVCEFCPVVDGVRSEFRKDCLATHIKSKHRKELSVFLLGELEEYPSANVISGYASNRRYNPIYSKLHDGCTYMFGSQPKFYENTPKEDVDLATYIKSDDNVGEHNKFIEEIMKEITIFDYVKLKRELIVRSTEMIEKNTTIRDLKVEIEKAKLSLQNSDEYCKKLEVENNEYKEHFETKETITKLINDATYYKNKAERCTIEVKNIREALERTEEERSEFISSIRQASIKELEGEMLRNDKLKEENEKMKKENEKLKTKMKSLVDIEMAKYKKEQKKKKKLKKKAEMLASLNESESSSSDSD